MPYWSRYHYVRQYRKVSVLILAQSGLILIRVAKRRERKTSGYFRLESHFHADARVRIWPSASDWLIFLQTRKSIWLVRLIGNTEGTVGISVTALLEVNFASIPGKEFVCKILQFSVYTRSRFACVRHGLCFWQCLRRNFDFGTREAFSRDWKSHRTSKESLARSHKSQGCVVRHILPTGRGKSIIFQLLPGVCKYLYLSGYSYPHHATILVVCPLSLSWILISANCETVAFQWPLWAAKTRSLCLSIRKSRVLLTKRVSGETCSVVMFNKTEPSRSLRMKTLILANTVARWPRQSRSSDTTVHHPSGNH